MAETRPRVTPLRVALVLVLLLPVACSDPAPSGPPASATVSCVRVPKERCDEAVASVARSLPHTVATSIEVTCVAGVCTAESGAMDTVVTLADGSQLRSSTATWSIDPVLEPGDPEPQPVEESIPVIPPPDIPMEPVCQGVPLAMCRTMAETAFGELSNQSVAQIVVRCSAPPCTTKGGTGDTVVTYVDGTILTSGWQYAN